MAAYIQPTFASELKFALLLDLNKLLIHEMKSTSSTDISQDIGVLGNGQIPNLFCHFLHA